MWIVKHYSSFLTNPNAHKYIDPNQLKGFEQIMLQTGVLSSNSADNDDQEDSIIINYDTESACESHKTKALTLSDKHPDHPSHLQNPVASQSTQSCITAVSSNQTITPFTRNYHYAYPQSLSEYYNSKIILECDSTDYLCFGLFAPLKEADQLEKAWRIYNILASKKFLVSLLGIAMLLHIINLLGFILTLLFLLMA